MPSFTRAAGSILFVSALALTVPAASTVRAGGYPSKPVRIIVPYGAGGIADVTMRLVADDLGKRLGQQFFIENRPGAGGVVGMQTARDAPADGYTLVMLGGGLTIAKALFKSLPYDIETDFIPISTTASYGLVIATKTGSSYKTIKDVIAAAKARPGTLNFGTINAGSGQNLSAELFRNMAGIDVIIIPYKTTRIWPMQFYAAMSTLLLSISPDSSRRSPMARWLSSPRPDVSARATYPRFQPSAKTA